MLYWLYFLETTHIAPDCFVSYHLFSVWFPFPFIIAPYRMAQQLFQKRRPSECTCERQMTFGCFLYIIYKLGGPKPTLLPFHFPILGVPSNFPAKYFKVSLGLSPFFLNCKIVGRKNVMRLNICQCYRAPFKSSAESNWRRDIQIPNRSDSDILLLISPTLKLTTYRLHTVTKFAS